MGKTNPNFVNGVPELLILQLLSSKEMYGYEIVKAIQTRSGNIFNFGEGCIYPILHYLEDKKLLTSKRVEVEGRSRNYYHLTAKGQKQLEGLSREWEQVEQGVMAILKGQHA